jgi:hypothetical protein
MVGTPPDAFAPGGFAHPTTFAAMTNLFAGKTSSKP